MAKKLRMSFVNSTDGKRKTIYLNDPKADLTDTEVQNAMDSFVGVFIPSGYEKDSATIVDTTTNELFDLIQ
ncbi:hypothetical protein XO10_06080 [Marinitoga sp. 1135]|uniref:DUF2922 domain-containing protein n=1 Tax=Marinitoga piezophila (strain DSM 14283 / JCM 11233 / KA3) TaxID=443254 RepID=H2J2V3_MARPK|nr:MULTISPECIES: DUF2922 domain-containing protein [Marinitoga]AEX85644.1 Protein of unknown function (DUF2922) [Marinitoga piezophila KA3]APT76098.1 hypothetical protein LN42_06665 [Marinitoga sp. 1137]NUU95846.1 hypothetical protein [Marinitoga sp. 1135]NUU97760.1 hypothetical protein [Marinitoga sp. 1138]